jgi:allantoinase
VLAEVEAIHRATLLAREAGTALHIVHVSSGRGVVTAAEARAHGTDVSIETCPHYLCFTEEDVERLGAVVKCAPPLRDAQTQAALWSEVMNGTVQIVGSDHSPAPPEMKSGDFKRAWGGVAGVQSTLTALLDRGYHQRALPLERIASLLTGEPARRFRIAGKGGIETGMDADVVLVDLGERWTLRAEDLLQRHRISPYVGVEFRGRVRRTIRRGETIYMDGRITAQSQGRFVRPERN